jgi:AraC-like DNA-binding protein/quercetin dioxygenase-like cupin family protein
MKAHFRPIPSVESSLIKAVVQENNEDFDYPWHYHPECELTYILSSRGVRYVGNSIENFQEDDLVLIGSNLPHCWINTCDNLEQVSAIVTYLKEDFYNNSWMRSSEFESIRTLLELSRNGIMFDKSVAFRLKEKCLLLATLPPLEKLILLIQILVELSHTDKYHILCEQGFAYSLNTTNNARINTIYQYIQKHYHEKMYLRDIAAQVHMSEEYFSRYFSKVMKKSFFEFLNEYKINRACRLLIETDKQVSEICYSAGFESIPFFYRQFNKFKNCQPKTYRQQYQTVKM